MKDSKTFETFNKHVCWNQTEGNETLPHVPTVVNLNILHKSYKEIGKLKWELVATSLAPSIRTPPATPHANFPCMIELIFIPMEYEAWKQAQSSAILSQLLVHMPSTLISYPRLITLENLPI